MINCNPRRCRLTMTRATGLYFEPLTLEDVLAVYEQRPRRVREIGLIVQFAGRLH